MQATELLAQADQFVLVAFVLPTQDLPGIVFRLADAGKIGIDASRRKHVRHTN
ncbi:hypothetical protein [Paraburkholderia piptadeniae]|uniref:hypothetical protein n=1 Tax=Paraburkholderia piptadeniae TaxID=1701573 RepID=UPI001396733A|nr:hypothetical protein [Paraburkholderia piptadeniae]